MTRHRKPSLALLYPGSREQRDRADPAESRFAALFAAFADAGVAAEPAVYHDDFADEVKQQLSRLDGVLVWCNPIEGDRRRDRLDGLLRELAQTGLLVSTHPDTIVALGTKDVLVQTRDLPFGSDAHRVDSLAQLRTEVLGRLNHGARVLKQHRGHSGIGVWRVERAGGVEGTGGAAASWRMREARRDSAETTVDLATLLQTLAVYFEPGNGGHMIDQAWQPGLTRGMVRAYLVAERVGGFGHQAVNALYPGGDDAPAPQPGPRLYYSADEPAFQQLRHELESGWIDLLRERVGLSQAQLPLLWDCDFIPGAPSAPSMPLAPRHVLCEVNVSSVSPFPPSCIAPLVRAVVERLQRRAGSSGA